MLDKALMIIKGIKGGFAAGISGGADSMCLLSLIIKAEKKDFVTVINIDHGIRGNSAADSLFVQDFCDKNGIKFIGHNIDVLSAALTSGRSIETEARIMRHAIFKDFCDKHNVPLLLAHNRGDNAESVLMHIFRGCGIRGLACMSEHDGRIIRPLIYTDKNEIYQHMRQNNIPYVEDETNSDLNYSRNRIRALVAETEKSFPGVRGAIASLSNIAKDTLKYIDSQLDEGFFKKNGDAILLDKRALEGFLAGEYVYKAALMSGLTVDLEQKHIAAIIALAGLQTGKSIDLPHGLRVFNEHDNLAFEFYSLPLIDNTSAQADAKIFDAGFGEQELSGVKIRVLPIDSEIFSGLKSFDCETGKGFKPPDERCFVDLDKLCGARLRLRREGDKFCPCGGRSKKLKEFFNEKKVPLRMRDRLPLIVLNDEVLVIPGLRISEKVKITPKTVRAAEIVAENHQYNKNNENKSNE